MIEKIKEKNVWQSLKETDLPIMLYGMGNGTDMVIEELEKIGVEYAEVFASDKFVRGHFFHGKKVLKYSEVCEKYDDFIVLMTFAVRDWETMNFVREISREHTLLSLTVPVAGSGLFTKEYVRENIDKFEKVYSLLADDLSRKSYLDVIKFKITGNVEYLFECYSEKNEIYKNIFHLSDEEIFLDLGAYDGDTATEFSNAVNGNYKKIIAVEPDKKNFKKLCKNTDLFLNTERINAGIWNENGKLFFNKKAGRQSRLENDGDEEIDVITIDSLEENISFIKMDVEGSEKEALEGGSKTICELHPKLYVCGYHRNEDLFTLPLIINKYCENYKIYFRQHPYIPAWECNFYAF